MDKEAEDLLQDLHLHYLRLILAVPVSCPKVALRLHTGMLAMKYRVWVEKVMLAYHLRKLPSSSLANMVYTEQMKNKWPGLVEETTHICEILEVEAVHETKMKKSKFKKEVVKACFDRDEKELRQSMKTKCKDIVNDKALVYLHCSILFVQCT